jgi:hypothetical protein
MAQSDLQASPVERMEAEKSAKVSFLAASALPPASSHLHRLW